MSFTEKFSPRKANGDSNMASKIIRENALVTDVRIIKPNGKDAFYILEIDKPKLKAFNSAWENDEPMDFNDYGKILHRGWGEPDDTLKAELREKYGLYEG